MIHPDGIEVYLKPAGKAKEGLRYAEFPVHKEDNSLVADDDHTMQTMIMSSKENFEVVVCCEPGFKMTGASALIIDSYDGYRPAAGETVFCRRVIQRSFAHEGQCLGSRPIEVRFAGELQTRTRRYHMVSHVKGTQDLTPIFG